MTADPKSADAKSADPTMADDRTIPPRWTARGRRVALAGLLLAGSAAIHPAAARTASETIDAFYEALRRADGAAIETLLTEDAVVRLSDLGFDMTREEFAESMDEVWADIAQDMTLRVRPDPDAPDAGGTLVRLVCYEFPSSTSMTRETTRLEGGRIAFNEQVEIAETCEGF